MTPVSPFTFSIKYRIVLQHEFVYDSFIRQMMCYIQKSMYQIYYPTIIKFYVIILYIPHF